MEFTYQDREWFRGLMESYMGDSYIEALADDLKQWNSEETFFVRAERIGRLLLDISATYEWLDPAVATFAPPPCVKRTLKFVLELEFDLRKQEVLQGTKMDREDFTNSIETTLRCNTFLTLLTKP